MHRCLVDCPAVEIEVELFRKRMCLIKKGGPRQKLADDIDSRSKESRQGGYNGLKQGVEIVEHARKCQICPEMKGRMTELLQANKTRLRRRLAGGMKEYREDNGTY